MANLGDDRALPHFRDKDIEKVERSHVSETGLPTSSMVPVSVYTSV